MVKNARQRITLESREKKCVTYKRTKTRIVADLSLEAMEARENDTLYFNC